MAIDPNNLSATAQLTFQDNFDNLSLWNGSSGTWDTNYYFGGDVATLSGNGEAEWYINANNSATSSVKPWTISNGVLSLTANHASAAIEPLIDNYAYTSGLLTTQFSFSQTYGYFEIDAKLPAGQGLWPAFWLLPTTPGAYQPEIDAMEVITNDTHTLWQFAHSTDPNAGAEFATPVPDMSAGFHRYGVDWEPDKLTYYFDGQVTGSIPTPPDMNGPMYMLLNLAVGGTWAGPPNASTQFPASFQIDYIRAYQGLTTTSAPSPSIDLVAGTVSHAEGNSGATPFVYTVNRTGDLSAASTVDWSVSGSGTSPADASDFVGGALPSGTVSFAAGQGSAQITINVAGDTTVEPDQGFTVTLAHPTGAAIGNATAQGLIVNDDASAPPPPPPPSGTALTLSPTNISLAEGGDGAVTYFVYTVTRTGPLDGPSTALWSVSGSGASPADASDFQGGALPSGEVFFGGGESSKSIWVAVAGDHTAEPDQGFTVTLSSPTGATLGTSTATGTILNDDGSTTPPPPTAPTIDLTPATVTHAEGNTGTTAFVFTATRSGDLSSASTVSWSVSGSGSAPADATDFANGVTPSGQVSFAAGQNTAQITVNVAGDTAVEPNETFAVTLSNPSGATIGTGTATGVITNDDAATPPPPPPSGTTSISLAPSSISQAEGNGGITYFVFNVVRSGDASGPTIANWQVSGTGANPADASDFSGNTLPSGQVFFGGGETNKTIWIPVVGDTTPEHDETFLLTLSNPSGAIIVTGTATGTILNDDGVVA